MLDILDGIAVHAVRGQRKHYRPLESLICTSTHPSDVAAAFEKLGFTEMYVADLDAILGKKQRASIKQLSKEIGMRLLVDAGISDLKSAQDLVNSGASKLVIGTETLSEPEFVQDALKFFGNDRIVLSLDLMNNMLLGSIYNASSEPIDILQGFCNMGLRQVIVLDLARVGSNQGVNVDFLSKLNEEFDIDLYVGGGVRNLTDLLKLRNLGLKGALVATALHSGELSIADLRANGIEI